MSTSGIDILDTPAVEALEQLLAPSGYMIYNNLLDSVDYIDVGKVASDGSLHHLQQTATAAWMVVSGTEYYMLECYLMANINLVSAYRSELEGIFRSLKHLEYLNITP